jgi:hypothetical protein
VANVGRSLAHGCVGRITALATDGRTRADLDPVQLGWAGVPLSRAFDAMDIRPGQREFLNVLLVRPGESWRLVTFNDPDFDPGFTLDLAAGHEHVMTLAVFADDVDAPMSSLAAEMTAGGEIITLQTSPVLVTRPRAARAQQNEQDHSATLTDHHQPHGGCQDRDGIVVDDFGGTTRKRIEALAYKALREMLSGQMPDLTALRRIDRELAPFYCPDCARNHCHAHWRTYVLSDEGHCDSTVGRAFSTRPSSSP